MIMSKTILGHPAGLYVCFATELWERFAYYGMRALLIFYLTQQFLLTDDISYSIYAAYTSLVWMLPVIGGMVADKYLGSRKSVTVGAVFMAVGFISMALPSSLGWLFVSAGDSDASNIDTLFLSMAMIIVGVGFLKTNISTVVGALYEHNDPRRDAGFTIFYMGINIGGFLAPFICGWVGSTWGWNYGFGVAGVGMLLGLITFLAGSHLFEGRAEPSDPAKLTEQVLPGVNRELLIYMGILALTVMIFLLMKNYQYVGSVLGAFGALLGTFIIYFSVFKCSPQERDRMLVVSVLVVFSILFWGLYEQMGSSLNLFADRLVDRNLFGWQVQASQLQALPPLIVIIFAPLFSGLWVRLGRRGMDPNIPVKFSLALLLIGLAFLMPVVGISLVEPGEKIALFWYVLVFFLMICGELCMVPIAMNMITRLCPKRVVATMMGSFFLSMSVGSYIAGYLAKRTSVETVDGKIVNVAEAMDTYVSAYLDIGLIGLGSAVLLYFLSPLLFYRMHERSDSHGASMIVKLARVFYKKKSLVGERAR